MTERSPALPLLDRVRRAASEQLRIAVERTKTSIRLMFTVASPAEPEFTKFVFMGSSAGGQ